MSPLVISLLMLLGFLVIVVFDVYLALDKTDGNTYSERIRWLGNAWPPMRLLISLGIGILLGHWWW